MSWNFSIKGHPKEVAARADANFSQPYIAQMAQPERSVAHAVHQIILLSAMNTKEGYDMSVSAYGSQSTHEDGVLPSCSLTIQFEAHKK